MLSFMILTKKMRLRLVFPLPRALLAMTYPLIALERRIIIFPCMKKDNWKWLILFFMKTQSLMLRMRKAMRLLPTYLMIIYSNRLSLYIMGKENVMSPIKLILLRWISIFVIGCWEIFLHVNLDKVDGGSPHLIFGEMEATSIREKERLNC